MRKQLYLLTLAAAISCLQATTYYEVGPEIGQTRTDIIYMGASGGFSGFTAPSSAVKFLNIQLSDLSAIDSSLAAPEKNITPTNSYDGTGDVPYLPSYIKEVYITGNATNFSTLVLGNTSHSYPYDTLPPAAYALPTPNKGTFVCFKLQNAPSSPPETWFQAPLPQNCTVVVDPNSADPCLEKVVPLNGGAIIIGSPVTMGDEMSDRLGEVTATLAIQRHPKVMAKQASTQAKITLTEAINFPCALHGLSMTGAYDVIFDANADLIDVDESTANEHITVKSNKSVQVYYSQVTRPDYDNITLETGAKFTATAANALLLPPVTIPSPVLTY